MDHQVQIRRLTAEGVEGDPRFGLRGPFNDLAKVLVTEECLKDFGGKAFGRQFDSGSGRLLGAPAVLPLVLVLGAREATPSVEVLEGFAVLRDHASADGTGEVTTPGQ